MAKILIIDDSKFMRNMLRRYLESAGFLVEDWLPLSPMEIPDRIQELKPDLVISDYQMPGMNGLSVARMVQKADAAVPILILTAIRDPELEAHFHKFGVRQILSKPIEEAALVRIVKEHLGQG